MRRDKPRGELRMSIDSFVTHIYNIDTVTQQQSHRNTETPKTETETATLSHNRYTHSPTIRVKFRPYGTYVDPPKVAMEAWHTGEISAWS